ncbi:31807_t:CDS:2, partial [Racocetra persica]
RLGLKVDENQDLYALVNVVMSPFPTAGNFFSQLTENFKQILEEEKCIYRNKVTPDIHGFIIQGIEKIYLVHLPMFNMENHRYQLILQAELPKEIMDEYIKEREDNPKQGFILGNQDKTTLIREKNLKP